MIDKIKCEQRTGNDIHKELIAMWVALAGGGCLQSIYQKKNILM